MELPPQGFMDVVGSPTPESFLAVGEEFLKFTEEFCELTSESSVVEIQCGPGRISRHIVDILGEEGSFFGQDNREDMLTWSKENISEGEFEVQEPSKIARPDEWATVVLAISVCPHQKFQTVKEILQEIYRVLKPGGYALLTFFLLNQESERRIRSLENEALRFVDSPEPKMYKTSPHATAHNEYWLRDFLSVCGYDTPSYVLEGQWPGRPKTQNSFQDLVVLKK